MTHVVCEPCRDCKYTDCCVVCPVECFYKDDMMLYIDPDECIDCEACVPECPVEAIFRDEVVPDQWMEWTETNLVRSKALKVAPQGRITERNPKHKAGQEPEHCKKKQ